MATYSEKAQNKAERERKEGKLNSRRGKKATDPTKEIDTNSPEAKKAGAKGPKKSSKSKVIKGGRRPSNKSRR